MSPLKLLLILSLALLLNLMSDEHYLLPDQKSDLLHTLTSKIKRAEHIQIIISKLQNTTLRKSIEKRIAKGSHLTLVATDLESAAYFAKYKHTQVYIPPSGYDKGKLALFVLLIDKTDICIGALSLDRDTHKEQVTQVRCSTSNEEIDFAKSLLKTYKERFVLYNQ